MRFLYLVFALFLTGTEHQDVSQLFMTSGQNNATTAAITAITTLKTKTTMILVVP
jgi:hypothetical protein